ncbi:MAG: SRPBCC domain-containing protein [Hyphomicrobiales bacterium]|nr:SRPBCC domain-containing protein [Hyphomicrobiales bacterium]
MTDTLTKTAIFAATPETVWGFLTDKDKLGIWYHPARHDLVAGEDYELVRKSEEGEFIPLIWGKVLKATKPHELVCTFIIDPFDGAASTVTWTLTPVAGGTRLTLVHEGIVAASGDKALHLLKLLDHGWDEHIQSFRDGVIDA